MLIIQIILQLTFALASENLEVQAFQSGLQKYNQAKYESAIEDFTQALQFPSRLQDYALYYRAHSYYALKNWQAAESDLLKIDSQPSHFKLLLESRLVLAQIYFELKRPEKVSPLFVKILRRIKRTEDEPRVLLIMARAERLSGSSRGCKYLIELYTRFPDYPEVKHWDADLERSEFLGESSQCEISQDHFRDRIRALLWAGLDQKAYSEILLVTGRIKDSDPILSDLIRSQFHLQEGDVRKAYELIKPHVEKKLNDASFLLNFASTASRAGESSVAMGTYLHIAKVEGKSKYGQRALFLASISSYQFQDYDGAEKRFLQFIKLYPRSPLAKEAKWHLAWLDYLRSDFGRASSKFQDLAKRSSKSKANLSKYQYWSAVSDMKLGRIGKAQTLLTRLSQDPLRGYYAHAASARLSELQAMKANKGPQNPSSRWSFADMMLPSIDSSQGQTGEDFDDEQNFTAFVIDEEERELGEESLIPSEAIVSEEPTEIRNPKLAARFETAQILKSLGLNQWAKWENFSIEQKTRNKEYLKTLITSYQGLEQFHRSSQIAHLKFISERSQLGYSQAQFFWSAAYPKAFKKSVEKWSGKSSVPEELIWAIMKQESQFKSDAISPVGALGLMQVMPMTGYHISRLQEIDDFQPPQLIESDMAIRIGSAYLKRLLKKFNNQYPLVAAAYNAGPHRADSWMNSFGHLSVDEFIEHIPFAETRNYVKKVINNQQIYREFYGAEKKSLVQFQKPMDYKTNGANTYKEDWESP